MRVKIYKNTFGVRSENTNENRIDIVDILDGTYITIIFYSRKVPTIKCRKLYYWPANCYNMDYDKLVLLDIIPPIREINGNKEEFVLS